MDQMMIQTFVEKEIFLPIDLYFAKVFAPLDASLTLLFSYLFAMARQGHLCIKITELGIYPSPALICEEEASLIEEVIKGSISSIPPHLCERLFSQEETPTTPFCLFGQELYLQKNWLLQQEFMRHIQRLKKKKPILTLFPVQSQNSLNEQQESALEKALSSPISLISGGPGTGKTFTAAEIVRTFYQSLSEEERKNTTIKLAAPTGKAAALLEKNLKLNTVQGISCGTLLSLIHI